MKYPKMFLIGLTFSALSHGIEQENEWIGIEKYWYEPGGYLFRGYQLRSSHVYEFCMAKNNDQNCAVINAYLLLQAAEKQRVQQSIKEDEQSLHNISEEMEVKEIAIDQEIDFVNKMKLENSLHELRQQKQRYERSYARYKKELQCIDEQLKTGNLSEDLKNMNIQLEDAFNSIVGDKDKSNEVKYLIAARSNARCSGIPEFGRPL